MEKKKLLIVAFIILFGLSFFLYMQTFRPARPDDLEDVVIKLERTRCYGTCPAYELKIFGNGTVVYKGEEYVNVTGKKTAQISQDKVKELVDEFYKLGYFSLKDSYDKVMATDLPSVITSIKINNKTWKVDHYLGDKSAPERLSELENKIDKIAKSWKWVGGH